MFCTNCGAVNKDGAKFCVQCGQSLGEIHGPPPAAAKTLKDEGSQTGAGFFRALFDFSFTEFITSKIIKFLYGLAILSIGLGCLFLVIFAFYRNAGVGVTTLLIIAPLVFIISVIYSRVFLEIIIVIFRIAEHVGEIAKQTRTEK